MAISTYSELQTSIANWLRRSDLTSVTPDFIALCESRLSKLLRLRVMETEVTLTATPGSRYITLPAGYIDAIGCWSTNTDPREPLTPRLPQDMPVTTAAGEPHYFAIDGANVAFERPASGALTFAFRYFKGFNLSNAEPTNWLLTNHPDLYLYGSLIEARLYARNPQDAAAWEQGFSLALQQLHQKEGRSRSRATMATEVGQLAGRRFDIYRGY